MRFGTFVGMTALALSLTLTPAVRAADEATVDRDTPRQGQSSSSEEKKAKDSSDKHGSCEKLCLADGEDPLDCEQYCVQVVAN